MALPSDPEVCLCGFLARDPYSYQKFPSQINPQLYQLARKLAPDLPTDLHAEIVHETWRLLLEKPSDHYNRERRTESTYLIIVMRDAIKCVRANYRPPGSPSRERRYQTISLEAQLEAGEQFVDDSQVSPEKIRLAGEILERSERLTAEALLRIFIIGYSIQEVAVTQSRSRFQVGRCISTALKTWRKSA
jgi:DNA-directed RNA polymerase specialized sigma24 family protein